jgi:CBS domain containing-hemolysin-like protein
VVSSELPIHELAVRLGREGWGVADGIVTVGGLVAAELGRIPVVGEEVTVSGVRLRVVEADERMSKKIEVTPPSPAADEGDAPYSI